MNDEVTSSREGSIAEERAQRTGGGNWWRRAFFAQRVVPYEHKAAIIRRLPLSSVSDAAYLYNMFWNEDDKWLKKILALRLLEFGIPDEVPLDNASLIRASTCQVEL